MLGLEHPFRPPTRQRGTSSSNSPPRRSVPALPSKPSSPKRQDISLFETKVSFPTSVVEFVTPDWQHNMSSTHVLSYEHELSSSLTRPSPFRPLSSSGSNSSPPNLPQYHQDDNSNSSSSPPTSEPSSSPPISTSSSPARSPTTTQHRNDHRGSGAGSGSFPSDSPVLETLREEPEEGESTAEEGKQPRSG